MHCIRVTAPSRLHLGFLDLKRGGTGRNFGSVGLTLDSLGTTVTVTPASDLQVEGPEADRAAKFARQLFDRFMYRRGAHISIERVTPAHIGLGSGTQLSLAIGNALSLMCGWGLDPRAIGSLADRGARSGVGVGAFEIGGFLIDGGKTEREEPPQIVARADFPDHWRVLLIFDRQLQGLHGVAEAAAFQALPALAVSSAGELCRLALLQALPSLLEADLACFGDAIGRIQQIIGDHFSAAQGGRFVSPAVTKVLHWLESQGITGVGQSSWGPTGFAMLGSETQANHILATLRERWGNDGRLDFQVCSGLNRGATIEFPNQEAPRTLHVR